MTSPNLCLNTATKVVAASHQPGATGTESTRLEENIQVTNPTGLARTKTAGIAPSN